MTTTITELPASTTIAPTPREALPAGAGAVRANDRDLRLDFMRGVAIATIVVDHAFLLSMFDYLTRERIGCVSTAEFFVIISGVVIGMVYRRKIAQLGLGAASRLLGRTWLIYRVCLVIVIAYCAMRMLGVPRMAPLTTPAPVWATPPGVPYVFGNPLRTVVDLLLLRFGPPRFNVLGMYIEFLAITPLCLFAMNRGWTRVMLAVSWIVYALGFAYRVRATPMVSEVPFPLFSWQLLYAHALAIGFHRERLTEIFSGGRGRALWIVAIVLSVGFAIVAWHAQNNFVPARLRLTFVPPAKFDPIYATWFNRPWLGPARVLNAAVLFIATYGILSRAWEPIRKSLGWFFIPIGQATLYVFIMHVFVMIAVDNVRPRLHGNHMLNTALLVLTLALVWTMVRTRFAFRWIPR